MRILVAQLPCAVRHQLLIYTCLSVAVGLVDGRCEGSAEEEEEDVNGHGGQQNMVSQKWDGGGALSSRRH